MGRVPVLMFAGLSPITQEGEMLGSRTEFIHWIQDVPDQAAIVRQYCKYTSEVRVGHNVKQLVNRAIQVAMSDPKGPTYLTASREALEQTVAKVNIDQERWGATIPCPLPQSEIEFIGNSLIGAKRPLVITGYLGRNIRAPPLLAALCDKLPIEVIETIGSDLCISSNHEAYRGVTISTHPIVKEADVILVLDCDVPWVPTQGTPSTDAKIFHLDVDPLKEHMSLFYINAHRRYKVSCELALEQLNTFIDNQSFDKSSLASLFDARRERYQTWRASLSSLETPADDDIVRVPYFISRLRYYLPENTTVVMEAVTNALSVIHHLHLTKPGTLLGTGAGGLGWLGGAAIGTKLAKPQDFVCAIVGDGTFLFSQMESAFWISRRYDIPFLLIVLNNGGWNAPKVSALLVHKEGYSSRHNRKDLSLSFEPSPDYSGIAAAAGNAYGGVIKTPHQVDSVLQEAVKIVQGGRSAVVEVRYWRYVANIIYYKLKMASTSPDALGKLEVGTVPLICNGNDVVVTSKFQIINPATGNKLWDVSAASTTDAIHAVDVANAAFASWSVTKPAFRKQILLRAADILLTRKEELFAYQSQETGASRPFMEVNIRTAARILQDVAGKLEAALEGFVPVPEAKSTHAMIVKEPYGVVLAIAPWNAPVVLGVRAVAFALATGNTVILKGSELSPRSFWGIGDIFRQAGLPGGCLNVLYHRTADAADVTHAIIAHPAIKKINFTGSTHVGSIIASLAGRYVKPLLLELGGKASAIILKDADIEKAASSCADGAFLHVGPTICASVPSNLLATTGTLAKAQADIRGQTLHRAFGAALSEITRQRYGTEAPPYVLINAAAVAKNKRLIDEAVSRGAKLLHSDAAASQDQPTQMRAVIVSGVTKDMEIYHIESFGPTVSLLSFETEEEALAIANDTEYGLSGAVFSRDLNAALRVARGYETGAVHINSMTVHDEPSLLHGGVKKSGYGRFNGVQGLEEFLRYKTITW
ncbi:NAD-dependent aldehyde dehydrogenase [Paramyrothecium foliicola]|nr:NAD-dependent aldehyde dehydrogenase [Paramyrothecium foliicola]